MAFTLRFRSGALVIFSSHDGVPDAGTWSGIAYTVPDDHAILAKATDVAPFPSYVYHFTLVGTTLTMHLVSDTETDAFEMSHQVGIYNTAPFIRQP